jgi:hypothetical protein
MRITKMTEREAIDKIQNMYVGQLVKISDTLKEGFNTLCYVTTAMLYYKGQSTRIRSMEDDNFYVGLDIDNGSYNWTPDMFEAIEEISLPTPFLTLTSHECHTKIKNLKVGQRVVIKNDATTGNAGLVNEMRDYFGKETTIRKANYSYQSVKLDIDGGDYSWSGDMFDVIEDITKPISTIVDAVKSAIGDVIRIDDAMTDLKKVTDDVKPIEEKVTFEIGEKIRIRTDITQSLTGINSEDCEKLAGTLATISTITVYGESTTYYLADTSFAWDGLWFEKLSDVNATEDKIEEIVGEAGEEVMEETVKEITFNGKTIKRVLFKDTVTIVLFTDGSKAVTRRLPEDTDDKEKALAMALVKSVYGKNYFNDIFKTFVPVVELAPKLDPNRPIIVGDRVRIKYWDVMESEFGLDEDGDIKLGRSEYYYQDNKNYCGEVVTIWKIDSDGEIYYNEKNLDITLFLKTVVHAD